MKQLLNDFYDRYFHDEESIILVILLALEISFTTPPFGLLLFVMKGVAPKGTTMREIYGSAFPYMGCSVLLVFLLILFPQLALWLPGM